MQVFCRNLKCEHIQVLSDPVKLKQRKNFSPLFKNEDDFCMSKCKKDFCGFDDFKEKERDIIYKYAVCNKGKTSYCNQSCIWNVDGKCSREEILVDKKMFKGKTIWVCRNQSDKGISGHLDWSRFGKQKDLF